MACRVGGELVAALTPNDVRTLNDFRRWHQTNSHTANLPNQPPQRFPPPAKADPSWVTIKVKNVTASTLAQWGIVRILGLVDPADDPATQSPPAGMLHPNRLWECELHLVASPKYLSTCHAVLIQELPPNAIGTAVVKGFVPGRLNATPTTTNSYVPTWVQPVGQKWITYNFVTGTITGNLSQVMYTWDTTSNQDPWAMINLNCGFREPYMHQDFTSTFGLDHAVYKTGPITLTTTPATVPCWQSQCSNNLWSTLGSSASIQFMQPTSAYIDWNVHWKLMNQLGTLIPGRVDPLYVYQGGGFNLRYKTTLAGGQVHTCNFMDHAVPSLVGNTSSWSYPRQYISGQTWFGGSNVGPITINNADCPYKVELQAWGNGVLENVNIRLRATDWGAYPVQLDGNLVWPGTGGGGPPPPPDP